MYYCSVKSALTSLNIKTLLEANPSDKDLTNDLNLVDKLQKQAEEADQALENKDYPKV
jgi:hypothetical protein